MIERYLFRLLREQLDHFKAHPAELKKLLVEDQIHSDEECDLVAQMFADQAVDVVHSYPRTRHAKFPLVAIILGESGPDTDFLGAEGGVMDEGPDEGTSQYAILERYAYHLVSYATHPDQTLYLASLVRMILALAYQELISPPISLLRVSVSAMDIQYDEADAPSGLFLRRTTLSGSREYNRLIRSSTVGRIRSVRGVHVDRRGSPGSDVGGVRTQVTVGPSADLDDDGSE